VDHEVATDGGTPVLGDIDFDARLGRFRGTLAESGVLSTG